MSKPMKFMLTRVVKINLSSMQEPLRFTVVMVSYV